MALDSIDPVIEVLADEVFAKPELLDTIITELYGEEFFTKLGKEAVVMTQFNPTLPKVMAFQASLHRIFFEAFSRYTYQHYARGVAIAHQNEREAATDRRIDEIKERQRDYD
jgi:hypothetical protein